MKTIMQVGVCLLAMLGGAKGVAAEPDGTVLGALAGAGTGLILGNNVRGIHREWAVPALALAGGIVGHEFERRWREPPCCYYLCVKPPAEAAQPPEPVADLQPGVDLIKVSILNSNGVRTDVNILRIKDKFVGPRGETYDALPTAEALAKKYGM